MNNYLFYIITFFIVVNVATFLMMRWDKIRSRKVGAERGAAFFMATMFGGIGVYAGMFTLRHKTQTVFHCWYSNIDYRKYFFPLFGLFVPMIMEKKTSNISKTASWKWSCFFVKNMGINLMGK